MTDWIGTGLPTRTEFENSRCEFTEMIIEMSPELDKWTIADMRETGEINRNRTIRMSHGETRFCPRFIEEA